MPSAPPLKTPPTAPILSPLLYVAPQMPMLPCNSCLTMCPTKCCHPLEGRGSEEGGRVDAGSWILIFPFFNPKKELSFSTWSSCFSLCCDHGCVLYFYCILPCSVFLPLTLSLSHLVLDSAEVMASAHAPPGHRKPLEAKWRRRERQSEGTFLLVQQVNDTHGDQWPEEGCIVTAGHGERVFSNANTGPTSQVQDPDSIQWLNKMEGLDSVPPFWGKKF